jgi:hypothetical protein
MKLTDFKSYERYRDIQKKSDRRKSRRPGVKRHEVKKISNWLKEVGSVKFAICHGARYGHEIDWFKQHFEQADIVGTDLFPKEHSKVLEWDFHKQRDEWIGRADFVYSNSLDHSYDPVACLAVWFDQLKDTGRMFLLWHPCQIGTHRGDCFGAHFHEYVELLSDVGRVEDVLYHGGMLFTIVARRKK